MKRWKGLLFVLAITGLLDSAYLTIEHFQQVIPPCSIHAFLGDCGSVLRSEYSLVFGIPLALIGLMHYMVLTTTISCMLLWKNSRMRLFAFLLISAGFVSSLWFVYLQVIVIRAICLYCMVSAFSSFFLFIVAQYVLADERKRVVIFFIAFCYRKLLKPILFRIDPERVHESMTKIGETMGMSEVITTPTAFFLDYEHSQLQQTICDISFRNPIGLAAGFDYEARLPQILPAIGFGYATVGTITNKPYGGNPSPRLGRLPLSQSLMVNKGFKNLGAKATVGGLSDKLFTIPIGISIGRTNTKQLVTFKQSVQDIISAYMAFEQSSVRHAYYELNISCPNVYGNISFYPPSHLRELLTAVDALQLKRPLFVKMPIEKSDKETLELLDIIEKHTVAGVIFGNLQKNRTDSSLVSHEVKKFSVGYFSGKPTYKRSNELIQLSYRHYHDRFVIIGCGGVFHAADAYEKITLGASLVQLITGMIFVGPQLIAGINMGLVDLLKRDGFTQISQAVGSKNK